MDSAPLLFEYRLTRGALEALAAAGAPVGLVTKGPMVVRDIDVLQAYGAHARCRVYLSVPTVDDEAWRVLEPGTAPPMQRLRAARALLDAGVDTAVLMAPLVPGLSTARKKLERTIKAIADHGIPSVSAMVMHLDGGTRDHFMGVLAREYPALVARYEHLYAAKHPPKDYTARVQEAVALAKARYGIGAVMRTRTADASARP